MVTANEVQAALIRDLRYMSKCLILPNTYVNSKYESDVIKVTKAFFWTEYEIKVSRSDFLADFKKGRKIYQNRKQVVVKKHDELISGKEIHLYGQVLSRPKYFYFVTPKGMLKLSEIPKHCGLIEYDPKSGYWGLPVKRKATILKGATRLSTNDIWKLAVKAAGRLHFQG